MKRKGVSMDKEVELDYINVVLEDDINNLDRTMVGLILNKRYYKHLSIDITRIIFTHLEWYMKVKKGIAKNIDFTMRYQDSKTGELVDYRLKVDSQNNILNLTKKDYLDYYTYFNGKVAKLENKGNMGEGTGVNKEDKFDYDLRIMQECIEFYV